MIMSLIRVRSADETEKPRKAVKICSIPTPPLTATCPGSGSTPVKVPGVLGLIPSTPPSKLVLASLQSFLCSFKADTCHKEAAIQCLLKGVSNQKCDC